MTLQQTRAHSAQHRVPRQYRPRLTLTPKNRCAGDIGGAWWPRSRDFGAEPSDLLVVLSVCVVPVGRVVYDPAGWGVAPQQLVAGAARICGRTERRS